MPREASVPAQVHGQVVQFDDLSGTLSHKATAAAQNCGKKNLFKDGKRRCTDVILLLLYIVFFMGLLIIGIYAFTNADLDSLLYKQDYKGKYCNSTGKLYLIQEAVINAGSDISPSSIPGICVQRCPNATAVVTDPYPGGYGEMTNKKNTFSVYGVCLPSKADMKNMAAFSGYTDDLFSYTEWLRRAEFDIYEAATAIMVIGCVGTLVVCLVWLLLMSVCAGPMVWVTIVLFFVVFASGAFLAGCNGYNWGHCSNLEEIPLTDWNDLEMPTEYMSANNQETAFKVAFWLLVIPAGIIFFATCCLCSQIRIAVAILEEVSKALMQMFAVVLFPIIPFLMLVSFFIAWSSVSVALYSMNPVQEVNITNFLDHANTNVMDPVGSTLSIIDQVKNNVTMDAVVHTVMGHVASTDTKYLCWFHFFGLLWTWQIIEGISLMTIAGAFCAWYWRDDKATDLGHAPVLASFWRTMRYHLGTIMFGSLIIAVVQFLRAVIGYIKHKLDKMGNDNGFVKAMMCILGCCFWCMEKCLKFISKNAYIVTAMKGCNFCTSCFEGLSLLMANVGRVTAVNMCSSFVVTVGKIMIIAGTSLIGYVYINGMEQVDNAIAPTAVVTFLAYAVTHMVMGIYDMGTDTILLCVLEDEHANEATGQYFAPPKVQKMLKNTHKQHASKACESDNGAVVVHGTAPGAMSQVDV